MARPLEDVYCTLLMSDSYLPGAKVLANSLRDAGTTKKLAVLVTLETLSADTISELKALYDYLIPVDRIRSTNHANLYLMGRPDLSFTFTKIALWRQTQFRKIVYLDADVVALRALDELFDIEAKFAAAPDIGWPDAFNSGVMVISPDMGEYWALQTMAATGDSFDGADQGLLNQYFEHRPWQRLKFTYNCTPNAEYQWEPAYRYYKRDIAAVHFIGKEKPWSGRHAGGSGVYGELLARWWAVHNRHMHKPKPVAQSSSNHGETQSTHNDSASLPPSAPVPNIVIEPEATASTTEQPMTEPGEAAENFDQGVLAPTPTVQVRKFSAPEMEWDATKFEPPTQSKPEAANFPSQTYTFSESHSLFKAPQAYPEPPKDMWYKVPENKPKPAEKPKPIFPWEREPDRPKATRVFAEDLVSPPPEPAPVVSSPTHAFSTVHYTEDRKAPSPEPAPTPKSADESWQAFQQGNANAWDSVPGIENYVRAIVASQDRQSKPASLQQSTGTEDISSPLLERRNRRESLIITDFPSATERPSLPVTPAPVRRPTFWGEERNEAGELPSATGVPDQTEWVCPQCGFHSSNASAFERRRESLTSATTAVVTPSPSAVPAVPAVKSESASVETSSQTSSHGSAQTPVQEQQPSLVSKRVSTEEEEPEPKEPVPTSTEPVTPPATAVIPQSHARSGLSSSGVPLASLTSPELLTARTEYYEFNKTVKSTTAEETSTATFEKWTELNACYYISCLEMCIKNPTEKLDQLRRSSLLEFEHLVKDEHPNPPLRALPEHSIATDEANQTSADTSSSGAGLFSESRGADAESVPGAFPITPGVAQKDFAKNASLDVQDVMRSFTSQNFFSGEHSSSQQSSSQDFTAGSSSTFNQALSGSTESSSSFTQTSSSTTESSSQHHSSSAGQRVQAGKMTFTLPDFRDGNTTEAASAEDDVLSPTQSKH